MDFFTALQISTTGLNVQRKIMNIIASNLANINTTKTENGEPYKRKIALLNAKSVENFPSVLDREKKGLYSVDIKEIVEDLTPSRQIYDPGHPDANEEGYVNYPNVDLVKETTHMMIARRSYEANVAAIQASKRMALKALELGK